jgi:hypothetical protein
LLLAWSPFSLRGPGQERLRRNEAARPALLGRGFPGHSGCTATPTGERCGVGGHTGRCAAGARGPGRSPSLGPVLDPGFARHLLRGPPRTEFPQQIVKCADRWDPCTEEAINSFRDLIGGIDNEDNTADNFERCHVGPPMLRARAARDR